MLLAGCEFEFLCCGVNWMDYHCCLLIIQYVIIVYIFFVSGPVFIPHAA